MQNIFHCCKTFQLHFILLHKNQLLCKALNPWQPSYPKGKRSGTRITERGNGAIALKLVKGLLLRSQWRPKTTKKQQTADVRFALVIAYLQFYCDSELLHSEESNGQEDGLVLHTAKARTQQKMYKYNTSLFFCLLLQKVG